VEFAGGNDVAFWDTRNVKPSPAVCVQWTSNSGNDIIYPCFNTIKDAKYAYNNLNHYVLTWYHKFARTQWNMATESYYEYMRKVPNLADPKAAPLLIPNSNGAQCSGGAQGPLTCTAPAWGIVNYLNYQFRPNAFISVRNEFYDDYKGQRSGYATPYSEQTLGVTWWVGSVIEIRPEVRFDYSYQQPAFDGGRKWAQFTFDPDALFFPTIAIFMSRPRWHLTRSAGLYRRNLKVCAFQERELKLRSQASPRRHQFDADPYALHLATTVSGGAGWRAGRSVSLCDRRAI
jgi:hypothetical protein